MKINDQNLTQEYINDLRNMEQTYQTNNDGDSENGQTEYLFMKSKMVFKAPINEVFNFVSEYIYNIIDDDSKGSIESVGLYKNENNKNGYYVYKYNLNEMICIAYKIKDIYTVKEFHFRDKKNKTVVIKNEKCIYMNNGETLLGVDKIEIKKRHKSMTDKMIKSFYTTNKK